MTNYIDAIRNGARMMKSKLGERFHLSSSLRQKREFLDLAHANDEPLVVLEAGASDGTDTVEFAKILHSRKFYHPDNRIFAFEPLPHSCSILRETVKTYDNVVTIQKALSSSVGQSTIYVSENIHSVDAVSSSSSLLKPKETLSFHPHIQYKNEIVIETITLDGWAEENGIKKIDFMWLDMQGMEMEALRSGCNILRTTKAIFSEVSFVEMYEKAPLYGAYKEWLASEGFCVMYEDKTYADMGNVLFCRK